MSTPPENHPPRRVGILGGMGPAATVDLMAKVLAATPAARDQDHVPLIVWNVPQVPPRIPALRGQGPSPLPAMLEGARFLEQAGATALAIACNTAHYWARELGDGIGIPLLHIADAAIDELEPGAPGAGSVALLGTRGTLEAGFYQERLEARGRRWIAPDEAGQRAIDRAIERVKVADLDGAGAALVPAAQALLARGAGALLLACTELPLAPCPEDVARHCLDPTRALARAIVRHALHLPCGALARHVS